MDRRTFLKAGLFSGLLWKAAVKARAFGLTPREDEDLIKGLPVWDAHAHPQSFFGDRPDPTTPTIALMKEKGVKGCVFAAVGDAALKNPGGGRGTSPKFDTARQLDRVMAWNKSGKIKIIRTLSDLDHLSTNDLGAIVGIEGGDALEGRLENLDYFFEEYGVRIMTLMHDNNNAIGRHQRAQPDGKGLTAFGQRVVEGMNRLGMIIDVAHADTNTLRDITALTARPVVDSHTDLSTQAKPFSRQRTWEEMEWVSKTDGVICTWPLSHSRRTTLTDWAREIGEMKSRLGMTHVGLGTDGGGRLPKTIEGYTNIGDLSKLVRAVEEIGLNRPEIQAYLGDNFERVVRANLKD